MCLVTVDGTQCNTCYVLYFFPGCFTPQPRGTSLACTSFHATLNLNGTDASIVTSLERQTPSFPQFPPTSKSQNAVPQILLDRQSHLADCPVRPLPRVPGWLARSGLSHGSQHVLVHLLLHHDHLIVLPRATSGTHRTVRRHGTPPNGRSRHIGCQGFGKYQHACQKAGGPHVGHRRSLVLYLSHSLQGIYRLVHICVRGASS